MKKLSKSKDKMIFGVCGGIAQFLGIDVSIIRTLTAFGAVFTGSILLWIYLILAIILPSEQ